MKVEVVARAAGFPLPAAHVRRFLNRALRSSRHRAGEVSVFLCGDVRMRRLNRSYRGKDRTTDVLSFPAAFPRSGMLGDIVISVPEVARQARHGGVARREVARKLLLHGLLHLLGYDHETDHGEMDALEGRLRTRLAIRA